jgi:hypothetical protein
VRSQAALSLNVIVVVLTAAFSLPLAAQESSSGGLAALDVPIGARPLGMGRAFVASSGDLQGLTYNPAGLALRDSIGVTFSRYEAPGDLDVNGNFGAVSLPLPKGVVTAAVHYEDLGEFEVTGSSPDPLATRDLRNLLLVGSYAVELVPAVSLGASVKYLDSDLGVASGKGVAFDAGALLKPSASLPLSVGVAVLNVGPDITFDVDDDVVGSVEGEGDELPSRLRYGLALDIGQLAEPDSPYGLELAADVEHDLREIGDASLFGGVAVDYRDVVIVRGGVLRLANGFGEDDPTGASFGAGVHWRGLRLDIARELNVNEVGDATHFSLGADF